MSVHPDDYATGGILPQGGRMIPRGECEIPGMQNFQEIARRARAAQEAINALGAGPRMAGTPSVEMRFNGVDPALYDLMTGKPQSSPQAPLVGIGGPLGSGKDALADYLVEGHEYMKTFMSEPLTEALSKIGPRGPWVRVDEMVDVRYRTGEPETLNPGGFIRYADLVEQAGYTEAKAASRDAREYLQGLGTEVGRDMMGEHVWTDMAQKKIRSWRRDGLPVVITGIRFPNELQMIREMGGTSVWIYRPQEIDELVDGAIHGHSSETSLSREDFDLTVHNTGSLDDLKARAAELAAYVRTTPTELEKRFLSSMD